MRRLLALTSAGFALLPVAASAQEEDEPPSEEAAKADAEAASRPAAPFKKEWLEPYFAAGPARAAVEKFRLEDWRGASAALAKVVKALPRKSPERLAARMLLAHALANQSQWAAAGRIFADLYDEYPLLAPYHAYNAARCQVRGLLIDAEAALSWIDKVPEGSVPYAEARLVRIDALRALSRSEDVAGEALAYFDRHAAGPRRAEAMFRRAEALEKLGKPAADTTAIYRRVWAEAPLEAWADRAGERLEALAGALPAADAARVRTHTAAEWLARGMVCFDRNRSIEAEAALGSALGAPGLDDDIACKARYHRAQAVWKQRQRQRAAPLFDEAEEACRKAGDKDLHTKALYQGARCWFAKGDPAAALARFARVEAEHADHSYADDARIRQAEVLTEKGDDDGAIKLLADVPDKYPKGDLLGEALWRLAFHAWRGGRLDEARKWLDENLDRIPHESIWYAEGRALYWKARVFEKQGKAEDARLAYERAVREYPLSVYALLSLERMRDAFPGMRKALVDELRPRGRHDRGEWRFEPRAIFAEPGFLRAVELGRIGLGAEARREMAKLGIVVPARGPPSKLEGDKEDLLWIAAVLLDRGRVWSASHAIPRYGLLSWKREYPKDLLTERWKLAYPRGYPELVARNAKQNGVPQAIQLAIMREESAFNPRTESTANAIGLTQMIFKTARRFANGAPVSREHLMDPARNLEIGTRFLGFQWKRYDKTAPLAIAAYNAGEGAVDRWLRERGTLDLDEFLETIPYDETRNYTKRVLASYFAYSWLYDPKTPVPAIPLAIPKKIETASR